MYKGILFSILAGVVIAVQSVFNTRLSDVVGFWQANTFIKATSFIFALCILLLTSEFNFSSIQNVNKFYLLGGVMGAIIVYSVMKGVSAIGVSYAISIVVITQLIFAFIINLLGLFGEQIYEISFLRILGLVLMVVGVVLFQFTK